MKKNILFVLPWLPFPLNSGGRQAIANGLIVAKEEYNIFLTYPLSDSQKDDKNSQELNNLLDGKSIILPYIQPSIKRKKIGFLKRGINYLLRKIQNFGSAPSTFIPNPYAYWITELLPPSKGFLNHINQLIKDYHIEIVQCEMLRNVAVALSLPATVKTIFVHHELGFVRHALELISVKSDLFDGKAYYETSKNLEVAQLNKYNCIITLSSVDTVKLRNEGVSTIIRDSFAIVSPKKQINNQQIEPFSLSFVGPDKHEPNLLGIKWFLENCWNQLLSQESRFTLSIIGEWSQKNIDYYTNKYSQIRFLGFVKDIETALEGTTMIVPIKIGSGIRMKILDAANLGVPFVSTSVGAEGIPVVSGQHCLIADEPSDFVQAIIDMQEYATSRRCSQNAQKLIVDQYSINALRENRINIYRSLYE